MIFLVIMYAVVVAASLVVWAHTVTRPPPCKWHDWEQIGNRYKCHKCGWEVGR